MAILRFIFNQVNELNLMVKNLILESKFDFNIVVLLKHQIQCLQKIIVAFFFHFTLLIKVPVDLHARYAQVKVTVVASPALHTLPIIVPACM